MQSNYYDIDVTALENNISDFILAVGEKLPKWSDGGVCNGFAFMAFRSEIYQKSNQYQKRLFDLSLENKESLEKMGKVLQQYHHDIQKFSKEKDHKQALNKALLGLNKKTQQHQIALIRKQYFNKARKKAFSKINEKSLLKKSCDYYNFIHSLLAAQDPGEHLYFHVNERYVRQEDFLEMLHLLPADGSQPTVKQVFNFAFDFTEDELALFFDNVLQEGDHVLICSTNHAVYLAIKDGKYTLYDPVPIAILPEEGETLAQVIKENFFASKDRSIDYIPLAIHIFSESNEKQIKRPKAQELLEEILENRGKKKHLDERGWDGATALYIAAFDNCINNVEMLAKKGANVNIPNHDHLTPAGIAALCDNTEILKILAKYKANLNKANHLKNTPLHLAAKYGHQNSVQILIESKANLNMKNDKGDTPLMFAIRRNHWDCAALLYQYADKKWVSRDLRMLRRELKISPDQMNAKLNPVASSLISQTMFSNKNKVKHNTPHPAQSIVSHPLRS